MPQRRMTRRCATGLLGGVGLAGIWSTGARAADQIRIGLPTKTYWPTVIAETALRQKLFEREGIAAELTVYRGGAEAFEALAAGAADLVLDPPALVATALSKGVGSKVVATGSLRYLGWHLMVRADSPIHDVAELAGKKVGITSAGSGSDLLALWTQQQRNIQFTRVPLGGGGLVPNLRSRNVDAVVLYSPLSFQQMEAKQARSLLDYADAVPPHLNGGWIAGDATLARNRPLIQKGLNALYGGLLLLRANRAQALALIAEIDEIPPEIAAFEYENTILKLETDPTIDMAAVHRGLDLASLGGMTGMASAEQTVDTGFKVVPTR